MMVIHVVTLLVMLMGAALPKAAHIESVANSDDALPSASNMHIVSEGDVRAANVGYAPGCSLVDLGEFKSLVCPCNTSSAIGCPESRCLVGLPGEANNPDAFSMFQSVAANVGFNVFTVQYVSSPSTYDICSKKWDDLECGKKARLAKMIGGNSTYSYVNVPESASVENRTLKALLYLANKTGTPPPREAGDPGRWARCLERDDTVKWPALAVFGGSEGSGMAAFAGYHRPVQRVMQFSGIDDGVVYDLNKGNYSPPKWVGDRWDGRTPLSRYYGFGEVWGGACRAWHMNFERFPLDGDWININLVADDNYSPGRHKICSDRTKSAVGHLSTLWDAHVPTVNGVPQYIPVWSYMLGHYIGDQNEPRVVDEPSSFSQFFGNIYNIIIGAETSNPTRRMLGPYEIGGPDPIASSTPVQVKTCDAYKSIKQMWRFNVSDSTLGLVYDVDGQLVLDCGACSVDSQTKVVMASSTLTDAQIFTFDHGHFVNTKSGLCLGLDKNPSSGNVVMRDCSTTPVADITWELASQDHVLFQKSLCLSAKHDNTTECQCHV